MVKKNDALMYSNKNSDPGKKTEALFYRNRVSVQVKQSLRPGKTEPSIPSKKRATKRATPKPYPTICHPIVCNDREKTKKPPNEHI